MILKPILFLRSIAWLVRNHQFIDVADPWARHPEPVPFAKMGSGRMDDLSWYVTGPTAVHPESVEELCDWLGGCRYVSDKWLFGKADYWQHPAEFERNRQGDCEDHALWAWRKLGEIGIEAEFVLGRCPDWHSPKHDYHAWVQFKDAGEHYLLESVRKDAGTIVLPLSVVRRKYIPFYSVNSNLRIYVFGGLMQSFPSRNVRVRR